jgi:hypothetical protein
LCFETKGGEEELSISCRIGASTSRTATEAAKKQVSAQLTIGGGSGRGGEGKLGRKEEEGLHRGVLPQQLSSQQLE